VPPSQPSSAASAAGPLAIEVERLSFRYPRGEALALQELSLCVREGSLFGLLGPNGSGKTTLISILAGILPAPASGVRVRGTEIGVDPRLVQAASALVPQEYAFYPRLSVEENLRFFAGILGLRASEGASRIDEVLATTGLDEARGRRSEVLSGGMKRRLNFAIGLLNRPRLLFLDEPTVGIDPQSRSFLLETVRRIHARGTTVVYTSHYMEEVEALCDEIGVLDGGRLLVQGSLDELLGGRHESRLSATFAAELAPEQRAALATLPEVELDRRGLRLEACTPERFRRFSSVCEAQSIELGRVQYGWGNLEELFLHLTRRQLRD
jgi:ABC-2 type transport system ATP-binding protein